MLLHHLPYTHYTHSVSYPPMDLNLLFFGTEQCTAGHAWGPGVRDSYILHYIHSGSGILRIQDKEYSLTAGQGFLIFPDTIMNYEADADDPWVYTWIGFKGINAKSLMQRAHLTIDHPIYHSQGRAWFEHFYDQLLAAYNEPGEDVYAQGMLYQLIYELIACAPASTTPVRVTPSRERYLQQAIEYIENSYSQKISVLDIAAAVGLDRTYLSGLFKAELGVSLQQFMIEYRMKRALELLHHSQLSISDISRSVGYTDPFLFSKMFKKMIGQSPKQTRERL